MKQYKYPITEIVNNLKTSKTQQNLTRAASLIKSLEQYLQNLKEQIISKKLNKQEELLIWINWLLNHHLMVLSSNILMSKVTITINPKWKKVSKLYLNW